MSPRWSSPCQPHGHSHKYNPQAMVIAIPSTWSQPYVQTPGNGYHHACQAHGHDHAIRYFSATCGALLKAGGMTERHSLMVVTMIGSASSVWSSSRPPLPPSLGILGIVKKKTSM